MIPAEFNKISILPNLATVYLTIFLMDSSSATLVLTNKVLSPNSFYNLFPFSSLISAITTFTYISLPLLSIRQKV